MITLRAPYALCFLHSPNCAVTTEEKISQSETVQFSLHTCTKSSRNIIQFNMNNDPFTVVENCVMTSTEEVICYIATVGVVGRKKKSRAIRRILIFFCNCVTTCIFVYCFHFGDQHTRSIFFLDSAAVTFWFHLPDAFQTPTKLPSSIRRSFEQLAMIKTDNLKQWQLLKEQFWLKFVTTQYKSRIQMS